MYAMTDASSPYWVQPVNRATFSDFCKGTEVAEQVADISRFRYDVFYQNSARIARDSVVDEILTKGLDAINDVLTRTGIHQLHKLKPERQRIKKDGSFDLDKALVKFTFEHDTLHFAVAIFDDRFSIERQDSSAETFFAWYQRLMPQAHTIETTIRSVVERKTENTLQVTQTQFEFRIYFCDFFTNKPKQRDERSPRARNVDVLQRFLPYLPDNRGQMQELPHQDYYRIDLTFSRLERFKIAEHNEKLRSAWYMIEAPFNENGRYLVLTAQLRNSSTESPLSGTQRRGDEVTEFDPDVVDDYAMAIHSFFRDRALEGIMRRLFENWSFSTSRRL